MSKKAKFVAFTTRPIRYASWWNPQFQLLSNQFPAPESNNLIPVHLEKKCLGQQKNRAWIPKDCVKPKSFVFPATSLAATNSITVLNRTWKLRFRPTSKLKAWLKQQFQIKSKAIKEAVAQVKSNAMLESKSLDVVEWYQNWRKSGVPLDQVRGINPTSQKQSILVPSHCFEMDDDGSLRLNQEWIEPFDKRDWRRFQNRFPTWQPTIGVVRIVYSCQANRWYCMLPFQMSVEPSATKVAKASSSTKFEAKRIIGMDPGCKTFQAAYNTDGQFMEFGKAAAQRLYRMAMRPNRAQSVKMNDLCDDMQKKLVAYLTRTYTDILIPKLNVKQILQQNTLPDKVLAQLKALKHPEFLQRLQSKAHSCRVHIANEHQSSAGCGVCGKIYEELGGSRHYRCFGCGYAFDRDLSASRTITLMNLVRFCGKPAIHFV